MKPVVLRFGSWPSESSRPKSNSCLASGHATVGREPETHIALHFELLIVNMRLVLVQLSVARKSASTESIKLTFMH